jgi:hypothetical protein
MHYVMMSFLFNFLLEFIVFVFVVDAIDLSCLDAICSSTLLISMISLLTVLCSHDLKIIYLIFLLIYI